MYEFYGDRDADTLLVTYGRLFTEAVTARDIVHKRGGKLGILKLCRIKPIDHRAILFASGFRQIHFFEEGMRSGSVADVFRTLLDEEGYKGAYHVTAVDNTYVQHAPVKNALKELGLDAQSMVDSLTEESGVSV